MASTVYESISHLFLFQFLDDIKVTQMNPGSPLYNLHTHSCSLHVAKDQTNILAHTVYCMHSFDIQAGTHECTHDRFYTPTPPHAQSLSWSVLWQPSTKCPGSGCSCVPTDSRPYTSLAPLSRPPPCQSSVCPYKDMPLYRIPPSCPVLSCPVLSRPVLHLALGLTCRLHALQP